MTQYGKFVTRARLLALSASFRCGIFNQAAVDPADCCVVTDFHPIALVPENIEPRSVRSRSDDLRVRAGFNANVHGGGLNDHSRLWSYRSRLDGRRGCRNL